MRLFSGTLPGNRSLFSGGCEHGDVATKPHASTKSRVVLSLPKSRCDCVFYMEEKVDHLHGFQRRVQEELNRCPVGPYVGPFDQSESLNLILQLPNSTLTYEE